MDENKDEKINMLLDVSHFFGESQGTLVPTFMFLGLGCAPILIYLYFGLYFIIPITIFIIPLSFYLLRIWMITIGREKDRLRRFKNRLKSNYSETSRLVRVKPTNKNGCFEYLGNRVAYALMCYNGTSDDKLNCANMRRKFIDALVADRDYDIYIQNINDVRTLESRYKNVKVFGDRTVARDFLDIIDANKKVVQETSLMTVTVIVIKDYKSNWKALRADIDRAIHSKLTIAYKDVKLVEDQDTMEKLLSRDIDGYVDLYGILREKYKTGKYYGSEVLAYDDKVKTPRRDTLKMPPKNFHINYKKERDTE